MDNITIHQNKRSKKLEIKISSSLTVENIDELKSKILSSLDLNKQVIVNLEKIANIDICGIQFLYSLQQEVKQRELAFEMNFDADEEVTTLLKKTGFESFILTNNK
jgi:anti-anti-sigma factor